VKNLDSDLLRTFLAIHDAGSFLEGAAKIYRSQSAASMQIRKLEEQLQKPVFERHGRGVRLTPTGERLEPVARQVIRQLDSTMAEIIGTGLAGELRVGLPDEHSAIVLSQIIAEFANAHPKVDLSVQCSNSAGFAQSLETGKLDIAVYEVEELQPGMEFLRDETMVWATSRSHGIPDGDPLPIALFDRDCWWRDVVLKALQVNGRNHRVVFTSESTSGVCAAIQAGIAVGVLNTSALNSGLVKLTPQDGFPDLHASKLIMAFGREMNPDICEAMAVIIRKAFGQTK